MNPIRPPLFLLLFFICSIVKSDLSGCFEIQRSRRLDCVTPVIRRSPVTEAECRQLCLTNPADCYSANYNYYQKICELLDVSVEPEKRKLLRRDTPCSSNRLVRTIGVSYLIPKEECLLPKDRSKIRLSPIAQPVITVSTPSDDPSPPKNPFSDMVPIVPDCAIGERARVQIIDGVSVDFQATVQFNAERVEKCIEACRMSTFPTGTRLPLLCRSATYDRRTSKCTVYPDALNPNGYLEYKPDNSVIYMEKICFSDTVLPLSCDEIFRRIPQHILLGHAAEIVTASSQTECIKECILSKLRKLECHSIMHYMDIPFNNCILNIHSRHTRPEYFLPELRLKVDYVEVPACASSPPSTQEQIDAKPEHIPTHAVLPSTDDTKYQLALNKLKKVDAGDGKASVESEWSDWTPCTDGIRLRERICTDCKETLQVREGEIKERFQTEPCIPNEKNEFKEALEKFVADQEKVDKVEEKALDSDEKAGFLKSIPTKIIPFPETNEEKPLPLKTETLNQKPVEFFGPPLKSAPESRRLHFSY